MKEHTKRTLWKTRVSPTVGTPEKDKIDYPFLIIVLTLLTVGSIAVFSASRAYAETHFDDADHFIRLQILFAVIGISAMILTGLLPPEFYRKYCRIGYVATAFLLLFVLVFGVSAGGAKRWLSLGPFSFQPSEIAKTMLILTLARYFSENTEKVHLYTEKKQAFLYGTLFPCLYLLLYAGLIVLQKHLSCLIILCLLTFTMMFLGGSNIKRTALLALPAVCGIGAFAWFTEYTQRRILIWLNPELYPQDGGWQTLQGLMAIGSGGLFGLGFGNSRLKYSYVSEPQNDFIFTVTAEEVGFIGAFVIVTLFFLFALRGMRIGLSTRDGFSRLAVLGLTGKVVFQVILNLCVVTNLLPNTGISLPFFSYGGSSLVMLMAEMGIILSVSRYSTYRSI